MNIVIAKLPAKEWQKYHDIRLLALKTDPYAFCSSYEEEINLSETDWRHRIDAMWFAIKDGQPVGMVGLLKRQNLSNQHCGNIISLWVRQEFRGLGIARLLVSKLQELASTLSLRKLTLQVTVTQTDAIKLYEAMGFSKVVLLKDELMKDGKYLDEFHMEWFVP